MNLSDKKYNEQLKNDQELRKALLCEVLLAVARGQFYEANGLAHRYFSVVEGIEFDFNHRTPVIEFVACLGAAMIKEGVVEEIAGETKTPFIAEYINSQR